MEKSTRSNELFYSGKIETGNNEKMKHTHLCILYNTLFCHTHRFRFFFGILFTEVAKTILWLMVAAVIVISSAALLVVAIPVAAAMELCRCWNINHLSGRKNQS